MNSCHREHGEFREHQGWHGRAAAHANPPSHSNQRSCRNRLLSTSFTRLRLAYSQDMAAPRALSNYIRMYRKRTGLTQAEVAYLLGSTHRSKVSRYERGVRIPSLANVIGFEIVFQAPLKALFAGTYEKVNEGIRDRARRLSREIDAKPSTPVQKQKFDALVDIVFPQKDRDAA